jgi:AGZA family xanthine/uracil permease-like MFS transporter
MSALTAVAVGIPFLIALAFAPLVGFIPTQAAVPALILIGALMMGL